MTKTRSSKALSMWLASGLAVFGSPVLSWTLEEAAKPYAGANIRAICDGYSTCLAYQQLAETFSERTGINVAVEVADLQQVQQQILTDALTGTQVYDAVSVISWSLGVWGSQGFAAPIEPFMNNTALRDPAVRNEDFVASNLQQTSFYEGVQIGIPYQFSPPFAIYRRDLASDPAERAAFREQYGYELPVGDELLATVDTWQQWSDMAAFFTRGGGETLAGEGLDAPVYGTLAAFRRHLTLLYDYERVLLAMGGTFFNDDGSVALDSDEARAALDYLLSWREVSPPAHLEATWDEQYSEFCAGNLFSTFSWADTTPFLESEPDCPAVAGNIGYFAHPGDHTTIGDGLSWIIPANSANPEASFLFLQYLVSREAQEACQELGCVTVRSDVLNLERYDGEGRMEVLRQLVANDWLTSRQTPPALIAIQDIVMEEISAAGAGLKSSEEAVAAMASRSREAMAR